jgi:hypothetical protein
MIDLNLNPSRKELKWFSIGLVIFSGLVGWFVYHKSGSMGWTLGVAGTIAALGLIGCAIPTVARWVYVPWVLAAYPIGWTVSHVLLGVIFYLIVTPMGLLMRLLGRDPMQRKFDPDARTYWISRPQNQDVSRYFRQF